MLEWESGTVSRGRESERECGSLPSSNATAALCIAAVLQLVPQTQTRQQQASSTNCDTCCSCCAVPSRLRMSSDQRITIDAVVQPPRSAVANRC